jgi:hypothetical protein
MPVICNKTTARFEEVCSIEEALPLLEFLKITKAPKVDLRHCSYLPTALLQLLLLARPHITAYPEDAKLAGWLTPMLQHRLERDCVADAVP